MHSHLLIPAVPLAIIATELGAEHGATPAHYAAAGGVILAIVSVLKGYTWARHEVREVVREEMSLSAADPNGPVQRLANEVAALNAALGRRPCVGGCQCGQGHTP